MTESKKTSAEKRLEELREAALQVLDQFPCTYPRLYGSVVDVTNEPLCGTCVFCKLRKQVETT